MTRFTLLLRNLRYNRGVNFAVIAGMIVATAVLTGALMVGDSVRASLESLALRRLGPIDQALISTRFFDASLADRLGADHVFPAIIVRGGAGSGAMHTADVQIAAVRGIPEASADSGKAIVNQELARELGMKDGGAGVVFSLPTQGDTPRDAALARRGRGDVLNDLSATVGRIETGENFVSLFDPFASQRISRNAWVNLKDLQEQIEQPGRVNVLLVHEQSPAANTTQAINDQLRKVITLDDYGLTRRPVGDNEVCYFARQTYIAPPIAQAARDAAAALKIRLREVSVNLINSVSTTGGPPVPEHGGGTRATIHYAVAAGITSLDEGALGANEIAINQWTAEQLHAGAGDQLRIDFYVRNQTGDLTDASKTLPASSLAFTIKYILPMSGLGADQKLPPDYKGLTDADSVADWNPPEGLTIDKKLVTKADEAYWKQYRAAPKLFFNLETAKRLWGGVYGDITGLRIPASDADKFEKPFTAAITPESLGMVFRPIKAEQVAAASGGTDFSMFFLMFSFFLIVAAALLVAMLFRLSVEQRARQLGLLSAVGFSPGALRKLALTEGMMMALVGGVAGLLAAVGYTSLILFGLRTRWIGAVGTASITLHIVPMTLFYGLIGSLFTAFVAILWAVWRVGKARPAELLAGGWGSRIRKQKFRGVLRWIGFAAVLGGIVLAAIALTGKISPEAGFGGGALLLFGVLAWVGADLRPKRHAGVSFLGAGSLVRLGMRNATRHTARGVLCIGLVALAAFTLITVAALKQEGVKDPGDKSSPTGGYRLILSANIPLPGDLNTVAGRKLLGFREPANPIFDNVHFTMLRQWAGQDISCLNLTKPTSPTILGLPAEMIQRGGFVAGESIDHDKIWPLLDSDQGSDIPVIADSDTQEYVLQIPLGGTIALTDQLGVKRQLKLVATIAHSIFQGQLLMSDANFRKLFPAQGGFGCVLVDTPAGKERDLATCLSSELTDYSVSVDTTSARLQSYQNVQNTYLETFQTLGALGLMLGTLGLAVVLVRTVIERRAELALLASLGFATSARVTLVLAENAFLLTLGLILGAASSVIGILPAVFRQTRPINAFSLAITLLIVLFIGLISSAIAVGISGVHVRPADLRRE